MDAAPVLPPTRPLFRNIHHRQIQHFQQTVVCLENALGFCNLPQLPVKALDRVRGIDQTADSAQKSPKRPEQPVRPLLHL